MEQGRTIQVERLPVAEGETIELQDVLLLADGEQVIVGTPTISDARVVAQVESHGRGEKVIAFRYKAKTRHRTKRGHRQPYTRLAIREILAPGQEPKAAKGRRRTRRKAAKAEAETPVASEAASEDAAKAPETDVGAEPTGEAETRE